MPALDVRPRAAIVSFLLALATSASDAQPGASEQLRLRLDTAQAAAVLSMLEARQQGREPTPADWTRLFATEGYVRLAQRETGMGRPFSDSAFKAFVLSDTLDERAGALRQALTAWGSTDLRGAAARALAYLPDGSALAATIYIVIKPQTNSFVWDLSTHPAIFLYLDPAVPAAKFENTVAHELHHIGLGAHEPRGDSIVATLPDSVQLAAAWMGAFGEGFAMLAAAGGPQVHPHAVSAPADRTRWDQDVARFNDDLRRLEEFFLKVIGGRFPSQDSVRSVAVTFYGTQGPWYTVGWQMAAVIERQLGRAEVIRCLTDAPRLLRSYNEAAARHNRENAADLALWSSRLIEALPRSTPARSP